MKWNALLICYFLILSVFTTLWTCKTPEEINPPNPNVEKPDTFSQTISLPTKESLLSVDLTPGFRTSQMMLSEGKSMIYSMYVPDSISLGKVPLILALHGGNGDSQSAKNFMECLPLNALREMDAIIFAPTGGQWWSELHSARVVELVRQAKMHWPIDSNKIAVTGYSNGGTGSIHFALEHPASFSAAIPMAANFSEDKCPEIPTYFIHGSEDSFYSPTELENRIKGLQQNGCDIQLKLIDGFGHQDACRLGPELFAAGLWLQEKVWD